MSDELNHADGGAATVSRVEDKAAQGATGANAASPVVDAAVSGLTAARMLKGWSIEDVSSRLKVSPAKLRALEAGDFNALPETTFVIGILRSYTKLLEIDSTPWVEALRRQRGDPRPALAPSESRSSAELRRAHVELNWGTRRTDSHSWWWAVGAGVVLVAGLLVWHSGNEPNGWLTRLRAAAPDAASSTVAGVGSASRGVEGAADSVAASSGMVSNAAIAAAENSPEAASTPGAVAAVSSALASAGTSVPAVIGAASIAGAASAPAVALGASAASGAAATVGAGAATLDFAVSQDTWVGVTEQGGKNVFSGIIRGGASQTVQGDPPLHVVVGNLAGMSSMTLDGKPIDLAPFAHGGNVARLNLP